MKPGGIPRSAAHLGAGRVPARFGTSLTLPLESEKSFWATNAKKIFIVIQSRHQFADFHNTGAFNNYYF
jgi:hypothetical protein